MIPHRRHPCDAVRARRKSKIQTPQFMAHILVPSLPPGARKSGYAPLKQRPCPRNRRSSGKGKARAGDNSGSNELMHVLQNAFECDWYGPGSTKYESEGENEEEEGDEEEADEGGRRSRR